MSEPTFTFTTTVQSVGSHFVMVVDPNGSAKIAIPIGDVVGEVRVGQDQTVTIYHDAAEDLGLTDEQL